MCLACCRNRERPHRRHRKPRKMDEQYPCQAKYIHVETDACEGRLLSSLNVVLVIGRRPFRSAMFQREWLVLLRRVSTGLLIE
jgi:hypothetical protein